MLRLFRLAAAVLAGAGAGWAVVAYTFVQDPDTFGYGYAEGLRFRFAGIMTGAIAGLGAELLVRVALRPHYRFNLKEAFVAMTLLAMALVSAATLANGSRRRRKTMRIKALASTPLTPGFAPKLCESGLGAAISA
jgi:hypothetical protein